MTKRLTISPPRRPLVAAVAAAMIGTSFATAPVLVQAQSANARFRGEPVTLNFVNADIEGVTRVMSAVLKQQFVVDPRVKGNITLYSETPLSPREAYLNFLAALRGQGFTVVESGGLMKVVPEADGKLQAGTVSIGEVSRRGDQIITQIFRLNHENANNLVPVLRPLISPNNTINANPGNNTLVITDYADNLQRIAKIISAMDTASAGDVEVIALQHGVAADMAALVQRLSDGSGAPVPGAAPVPQLPGSASGVSVMVDARSNSLIVRAPNASRMASVKALIAKLDQPGAPSSANGNIHVIYLKNADATRLATVLRAAYAAGNTGGGAAALGGGASANVAQASPSQSSSSNASGASAAATAPVTAAAQPSTGGFIQADPATNSLIITAPEPVYRQLRAVIDQLDSRRAQVYIESMIVEIVGDDAADFGFQWQGMSGRQGDSRIVAGGTNFGDGSTSIVDLSVAAIGGRATAAAALQAMPGGFNIGVLKNIGNGMYGLSALARILQSQTNTNIVSTPNLITLDNEEAKIVVGSNVPFITGQYTNTGTSTSSPFQTVERKDVGITLRIKPQIGADGTVQMTIYQESSSLSGAVAPGTENAGPTTNKRSIESKVIVDDGQILVLGGLIEDRFEEKRSKVPLLGDLPYIGALFRSESREKRRTNMMVFLRPIVMRDGASATNFSMDRYDLMRTNQQDAQPRQSLLLPINESPVLPPMHVPQPVPTAPPPAPLSAPPTPAPAPAPVTAPVGSEPLPASTAPIN